MNFYTQINYIIILSLFFIFLIVAPIFDRSGLYIWSLPFINLLLGLFFTSNFLYAPRSQRVNLRVVVLDYRYLAIFMLLFFIAKCLIAKSRHLAFFYLTRIFLINFIHEFLWVTHDFWVNFPRIQFPYFLTVNLSNIGCIILIYLEFYELKPLDFRLSILPIILFNFVTPRDI